MDTTGPVQRLIDRLALGLVLLLPWFLLHVRAAAEADIDLVGAAFLVHCAMARRWGWLRQAWVLVALGWWGWLVVCTVLNAALPGQDRGALLQAVLVGRVFIFVAALQVWVFADGAARRWFFASLAAATAYVAGQTLLQFATGYNLFGNPRSADGELTGPFLKPRDAPTFVRMLFPALLPPVGALLARRQWGLRLGGVILFAAGFAVVVLIGQRMPVLLAGLGLLVTALLLPRLRTPVAIAVIAGGVLIAATSVIAPPTFYRLVTKFSQQIGSFADSHYGLIAARSLAIAEQHPLTGRGYDGFRTGCDQSRYFQGWHWPGDATPNTGGDATICVTHPHNHYLQALTDAGLPGLLLFSTLIGLWLVRLGRGLWRNPDPLRAGLFVAALIMEWPIASTSPFTSMPIGGWFLVLLGWGLAEAQPARTASTASMTRSTPSSARSGMATTVVHSPAGPRGAA